MTLTGADMCLTHMLFYFIFFIFFALFSGDNAGGAGTGSSFHNRIRYKYPMETDVPGPFGKTTDLQTDRFARKRRIHFQRSVSGPVNMPTEACKTCC